MAWAARKWRILMVSGEANWLIISSGGDRLIDVSSLATFLALNPFISSTCANLYGGDIVCVAGSPATPTAVVSTTTATTTQSAPTTVPTSVPLSCTKNDTITANDSCSAIATRNKIYLAELYALNPGINSTSCPLTLGAKICVKSSWDANCTNTVAANGGCGTIASTYGISTQMFMSLNPFINNDCSNLWSGDYVCVAGISNELPPKISLPGNATCLKTYTLDSSDINCGVVDLKNQIYFGALIGMNPQISATV